MIVELTLAQAATSMAGAVAYAVSKCKSGENSEAIIPPASIFKRLRRGNVELVYVECFDKYDRLEHIILFEYKDNFFTKLKSWRKHYEAHLMSIDARKEYGWQDHPEQHSDVKLPLGELLDFMSSDEF